MIKNLKMDDYLFHSMKPYPLKIEMNQNTNIHEKNIKYCCEITKKILETKAILPRNELKKTLSEEEYTIFEKNHHINWNKENNVSISIHPNKLNLDLTIEENAFTTYTKMYPSFILNPSLLRNLPICKEPYHKMPDEIQIEGKIPTSYIVGIALPNIYLEEQLKELEDNIKHPIKWMKKNSYYLDMMKEDLKKETAEKILNDYYLEVIYLENMLKDLNSDFKLYHTLTGTQITSSNELLIKIKKTQKHFHQNKF